MTYEEFLNRYRFDINDPNTKIGSGGFGKVYKAYDSLHHKWVAIKVVPVDHKRHHISLRAEMEKAQSLPDHTNIVRYEACYRFELPGGTYDYGVMQFYEEGNLRQLLKNTDLSSPQREALAKGILAGISFLHEHRILHRDLKSSNVLIARFGEEFIPLIADFGLSKQLEEEASQVENSIVGGSALFTAPEQLVGDKLRYNADLWSYGVIIYQLFTGQFPYYPEDSGNSASGIKVYKKIMETPVPPLLAHIPDPWKRICQKCLVVDPVSRVADAEELRSLLKSSNYRLEKTDVEVKEERDIKSPPVTAEDEEDDKTTQPKRSQILAWSTGLGVVLIIILLKTFTSSSDPQTNNVVQLQATESQSGKWGYKNNSGQWVISPRFVTAKDFSADGYAAVELDTLGQSYTFKINKQGDCVSGCPQLSNVDQEQETIIAKGKAAEQIKEMLTALHSVEDVNKRDRIIQKYDLPAILGTKVNAVLDDQIINENLADFLTYLSIHNRAYYLVDFEPEKSEKPGYLELKTD